jgi:GrpB-like predicted nucleotidyltransferase (UPF0157 family)
MATVIVVDYDPEWPRAYGRLRDHVWPIVSDLALRVEHVGSTSVPGLASKPIIDMSIVVACSSQIAGAIERLGAVGYEHRGDLGIEGREAFKSPPGPIRHHLYLCPEGSLGLDNQLAVRDYLRLNWDMVQAYSNLKVWLAEQFPDDIDEYVAGKSDFIQGILRAQGFSDDRLSKIASANKIKPPSKSQDSSHAE